MELELLVNFMEDMDDVDFLQTIERDYQVNGINPGPLRVDRIYFKICQKLARKGEPAYLIKLDDYESEELTIKDTQSTTG